MLVVERISITAGVGDAGIGIDIGDEVGDGMTIGLGEFVGAMSALNVGRGRAVAGIFVIPGIGAIVFFGIGAIVIPGIGAMVAAG